MNEFIIIENLSYFHQEKLFLLYRQMWWADHRTKEEMEKIIKNSSFVVGIIDYKRDRLVGFARVLTDYFTLAYIFDVIVK